MSDGTGEVITLNVGGRIYTTTLETLTRYPDSALGSMFSNRLPSSLDKNNNYFIDRDGPLFRYVLNFLRSSHLFLPDDFKELDLLADEADFYGIPELIQAVTREREAPKNDRALNVELRMYSQKRTGVHSDWTIFGNPDVLLKLSDSPTHFLGEHKMSENGEKLHRPWHMGFVNCRDGTSKYQPQPELTKQMIFKEIWKLGYRLRYICDSVSELLPVDVRVRSTVHLNEAKTWVFHTTKS
ncbi:BTB/POZ domain-containing protein KCTD6-like [Amphiura filiformis]|uniref:BTB/POZ domain-containing protein KCTD6-like n=1 Tax=Amphiura filiformis TaxID=82378 RepID=UPI003B2222A4